MMKDILSSFIKKNKLRNNSKFLYNNRINTTTTKFTSNSIRNIYRATFCTANTDTTDNLNPTTDSEKVRKLKRIILKSNYKTLDDTKEDLEVNNIYQNSSNSVGSFFIECTNGEYTLNKKPEYSNDPEEDLNTTNTNIPINSSNIPYLYNSTTSTKVTDEEYNNLYNMYSKKINSILKIQVPNYLNIKMDGKLEAITDLLNTSEENNMKNQEEKNIEKFNFRNNVENIDNSAVESILYDFRSGKNEQSYRNPNLFSDLEKFDNKIIEEIPEKQEEIQNKKHNVSKKINISIDSSQDMKELNYNQHEFKIIEVVQSVKPPVLTLHLETVVNNPGIYPIEEIRKMCDYKNQNLQALKPETTKKTIRKFISESNIPDLKVTKKYTTSLFESLPKPEEIESENFDKYIPPNKDQTLINLMKSKECLFASSTSGLSNILSHYFYKLTNFKSPHFYNLSEKFTNEPFKFMMFQRKPISIAINKHGGNFHSISQNKIFADKNDFILLKMGKYMEKIFTNDEESFRQKYMQIGKLIDISEPEYFNFVTYDKILLRSQIDCSTLLEKTKKNIFFEIKTRACSPIRYDINNYKDYLDYEIKTLTGIQNSYEREFYDLIRGGFLKYIFQLKIGGMHGAFISYHNTEKIFGFEYISLIDMERRVFGNTYFSDLVFKASFKLLQETFTEILSKYDTSKSNGKLFIGVYANEWKNTLDVLVEVPDMEIYENDELYNYRHIVDFYNKNNYKPKVDKYTILVTPMINNISTSFSPILYEKYDSFNVKYKLQYDGLVGFEDYMKFIHEVKYSNEINLENEFTGTWSLMFERD